MDEVFLESLRTRFNRQQHAVRVVSLLSPACLVCQYGQGVLRTMFELASEAELRGLIAKGLRTIETERLQPQPTLQEVMRVAMAK